MAKARRGILVHICRRFQPDPACAIATARSCEYVLWPGQRDCEPAPKQDLRLWKGNEGWWWRRGNAWSNGRRSWRTSGRWPRPPRSGWRWRRQSFRFRRWYQPSLQPDIRGRSAKPSQQPQPWLAGGKPQLSLLRADDLDCRWTVLLWVRKSPY